MKRLTVAIAVLVGVGGLATPAAAAETRCTGTLGAVTVDDLRVPAGATCTLEGTRVLDDVVVARNARLFATGVRVGGNIDADDARRLFVRGSSRVNGSIDFDDGGSAAIRGSRIGNNVQLTDSAGAIEVRRNVIGGNLQVDGNTGGVAIIENTIGGNLQCQGNVPAPTGGGNVVSGAKQGQCATL